METILIIEDDTTLLRGLQDTLGKVGYTIHSATDGESGLHMALDLHPDLILLDIMLPQINGYEICRLLRNEQLEMPIIMLTAKGEESDIVLGLSLGADDYVTKPFSRKELLARIAAFLRRQRQSQAETYAFGPYLLDVTRASLQREGQPVSLSPKELKLLIYFAQRVGHALSRDTILNQVWGYNSLAGHRSVDRFVTTLRNKLEPNPHHPIYFHTLRSIGYKFEPPE